MTPNTGDDDAENSVDVGSRLGQLDLHQKIRKLPHCGVQDGQESLGVELPGVAFAHGFDGRQARGQIGGRALLHQVGDKLVDHRYGGQVGPFADPFADKPGDAPPQDDLSVSRKISLAVARG